MFSEKKLKSGVTKNALNISSKGKDKIMFLWIFLHDNPNFWGDDKTHTRKKSKKRIVKKYKGVCLLSSTNSNFSEKCDCTEIPCIAMMSILQNTTMNTNSTRQVWKRRSLVHYLLLAFYDPRFYKFYLSIRFTII